jgi:hypothetical protein
MKPGRKISIAEIIIISFFSLACLIFFGVFYRYHIFFEEQLQIFLITGDHFLSYLSKPAFLSSYAGDFLTQFYYLIGGGAVVVTITLGILWLSVRQLLKKISRNNYFILLPVLPVVLSWIALCDFEFPVSNIISLIISVIFTLIYVSIRSGRTRILAGIILLPFLYISAGSNFYLLTVIAVYCEIFRIDDPGRFLRSLLLCAITVFIPFSLSKYYLITIGQSFTYMSEMSKNSEFKYFLPLMSLIITVIIAGLTIEKIKGNINSSLSFLIQFIVVVVLVVSGIWRNADFSMERILRLDYEASHNRWKTVYDLSQKYKMRDNLSAYYTNMALARLGLISDSLMEHYQPAAKGLFIPVNPDENYIAITFSNEVYWQLGDINASQHSALLGMIFSPRAQNSRLMKRLTEINIVNGEYAVAEKYIKILEKTLFHHKWASSRRKFLYDEKECSGSSWIQEKRAIMPSKDLLKKRNEYAKTLRMLADDHPENRMAVDYLLCYYLLCKDIRSFTIDFDKYYASDRNRLLPKVYQEGLLIWIASGGGNFQDYNKFRFSPAIVKDFKDYSDLFEKNRGNGTALQKKYSKTYWFYFHYVTIKSE